MTSRKKTAPAVASAPGDDDLPVSEGTSPPENQVSNMATANDLTGDDTEGSDA